jgi:hypothetical protein
MVKESSFGAYTLKLGYKAMFEYVNKNKETSGGKLCGKQSTLLNPRIHLVGPREQIFDMCCPQKKK